MAILVAIPILILGIIIGSAFEFATIGIMLAAFFLVIFSFIVSFSNNCAEAEGFGFFGLIFWLAFFVAAYGLAIGCLIVGTEARGEFAGTLFGGLLAAFLPTCGVAMFYYYRMLGTGDNDIVGGSSLADSFGLLKRPMMMYLSCAVVCVLCLFVGNWLTILVSILGGVFGPASCIYMRIKNGSILC